MMETDQRAAPQWMDQQSFIEGYPECSTKCHHFIFIFRHNLRPRRVCLKWLTTLTSVLLFENSDWVYAKISIKDCTRWCKIGEAVLVLPIIGCFLHLISVIYRWHIIVVRVIYSCKLILKYCSVLSPQHLSIPMKTEDGERGYKMSKADKDRKPGEKVKGKRSLEKYERLIVNEYFQLSLANTNGTSSLQLQYVLKLFKRTYSRCFVLLQSFMDKILFVSLIFQLKDDYSPLERNKKKMSILIISNISLKMFFVASTSWVWR